MRILIISQYYSPEPFLISDIAPSLVKLGHQVTVLAGRPNYPSGVVYEGYAGNTNSDVIEEGVRILRLPIIPRGKSSIQLVFNYFSYMFKANSAAKRMDGQFDVVFLYQLTPILQAYPAIQYARRNKIRLVCYCLDWAPLSGASIISSFKPLYSVPSNSTFVYVSYIFFGILSLGP